MFIVFVLSFPRIGKNFDLCLGSHRELNGVVVSLDELGHLTCSYLGTDPTLFAAGTKGQRDVNYNVRLLYM